jgi:hypothetical protein
VGGSLQESDLKLRHGREGFFPLPPAGEIPASR